jgi:hypothetical protein
MNWWRCKQFRGPKPHRRAEENKARQRAGDEERIMTWAIEKYYDDGRITIQIAYHRPAAKEISKKTGPLRTCDTYVEQIDDVHEYLANQEEEYYLLPDIR